MGDSKVVKCFKKALKVEALDRFLESLEEPVQIRDNAGTIVKSTGEVKKGEEFAISYGWDTIGSVYGSKRAAGIVPMLEYIINSEMEKMELADETLDVYRELNLLFNMSEKISATLNPKQVSEVVMQELKTRVEFEQGAIFLKDPETNELNMLLNIGDNQKENEDFFVNNSRLINAIMTSKNPEIIADLSADSRNDSNSVKIKALIIAPLMTRGKVIGAVFIGSTGNKYYKSAELKILNSVALQAAVALENSRLYVSLEKTFFETVNTLAQTIDIRDRNIGGHTMRVAKYCEALGAALKLPVFEVTRLKFAAMLHDLGNIGVPDSILLKTGPLTDEEFNRLKEHPKYGEAIVKKTKWLKNIAVLIRAHHERYDGKGYPDGLKGTKIPLISRIIAVADSFDAMTSDRAYRKALLPEAALEEIRKNAGSQFDPEIAKVFVEIYKEKSLQNIGDIKDSSGFDM